MSFNSNVRSIENRVAEEIRQHRHLAAMKLYRELVFAKKKVQPTLLEAKAYVDQLAAKLAAREKALFTPRYTMGVLCMVAAFSMFIAMVVAFPGMGNGASAALTVSTIALGLAWVVKELVSGGRA